MTNRIEFQLLYRQSPASFSGLVYDRAYRDVFAIANRVEELGESLNMAGKTNMSFRAVMNGPSGWRRKREGNLDHDPSRPEC